VKFGAAGQCTCGAAAAAKKIAAACHTGPVGLVLCSGMAPAKETSVIALADSRDNREAA
jgi:hypothetical protein